jgi:amino acid permease
MAYPDEMIKDAKLITKLLPSENVIVQIVELLFILNLFISYPLVIYPSNIIIENYAFSNFNKSTLLTWLKNSSRTLVVAFTLFMGLYFEDTLDRLTSVVGSVCLTPIAFILPGIFHLNLIAETKWMKFLDFCVIAFGTTLMVVITGYTLINWNSELMA